MKTLEEIREYITSEKVAEKSLVVIIKELVTEEVNSALQEELNTIWEAFNKEDMNGSQNYILGRIEKVKK